MKGRLATAQVLASGEEQFVQASSRIVLPNCRLILAAVPWFWWVEASPGGLWGARRTQEATVGFLRRGCLRAARSSSYRYPPG